MKKEDFFKIQIKKFKNNLQMNSIKSMKEREMSEMQNIIISNYYLNTKSYNYNQVISSL